MSLDAMVWSMKQRGLKPSERAVLHSLAYHANDKGECWPSYGLIGDESGVSRRSAITIIQRLVEKSYIFRIERFIDIDQERRRQSSNLFKLNMNVTANIIKPGEIISPPGEKNATTPVKPGTSPSEAASPTQCSSFTPPVKQLHSPSEAASPEQVIEQVTEQVIERETPPAAVNEQKNTDTRLKFQMTQDWQPDQNTFNTYCLISGINPKSILDSELEEFRRYWCGENNVQTQSQWENKLVVSLRHNRTMGRIDNFQPLKSDEEIQVEQQRNDSDHLKFKFQQEIAHLEKMIDMTNEESAKEPLRDQLFSLRSELESLNESVAV